jgi:hypothetical protein
MGKEETQIAEAVARWDTVPGVDRIAAWGLVAGMGIGRRRKRQGPSVGSKSSPDPFLRCFSAVGMGLRPTKRDENWFFDRAQASVLRL